MCPLGREKSLGIAEMGRFEALKLSLLRYKGRFLWHELLLFRNPVGEVKARTRARGLRTRNRLIKCPDFEPDLALLAHLLAQSMLV